MALLTRGIACYNQMTIMVKQRVAFYMVDQIAFLSLCMDCRIGYLKELSSGVACCLDDPITMGYSQLSI